MRKEVKKLRTINSKHFLNKNGTITAEISKSPKHYIDNKGQYNEIDLSLVKTNKWEFSYSVEKNNYRSYFNDITDILNPTLASFEVDSNGTSEWVNYKMVDAKPQKMMIRDNVIKYENVFDDVDLEYIVGKLELKENIIVKKKQALRSFSFTLKMSKGLIIEKSNSGEYFFIDSSGNVVFKIRKFYAVDANGHKTYGVDYSVKPIIINGKDYIKLTVNISDKSFLENAHYPITIDPTTTSSMTDDDWGWVRSNEYRDDRSTLMFGQTDNGTEYRSFAKWDLSNLPEQITEVNHATFKSVLNYDWYGGSANLKIGRCTSNWVSSSMNYPGPSATQEKTFTISSTTNVLYELDITEIVRSWVIDGFPNYGIRFRNSELSNLKRFLGLDDPDTELLINYNYIVKTQIGTMKSNGLTIPVYDPTVGMDNKNQLRVNTPNGIGCFELVDIYDVLATPLRVSTSNGIKSIAKE